MPYVRPLTALRAAVLTSVEKMEPVLPRFILFLIALTAAGCTSTSVEPQPGSENIVATATAACFGLCRPDPEELMAAMHRQCEWPSVPAIHLRGSEKNGLLGVPHAAWRFSCLTVSPETEVDTSGNPLAQKCGA